MQAPKPAATLVALAVVLGAAVFVLRARVEMGWLPANDLYTYFYPKMLYALASWHDGGRGLLWNPFQNCGEPFFGVSQTGLTYPPFWLYLVFAPERALRAVLLVQLVIAGSGAYVLGRELGARPLAALTGALAFEMGNITLALIVSSPIHSGPYVWMPWALAGCERLLRGPTLRRALSLALVLAVTILPGMPQTVFFIYLLIGFRVLWELAGARVDRPLRVLGLFVLALTLPALLAAIQLFPDIEMARASLRRGGLSAHEIDPYPPWGLATLRQQLAMRTVQQPFLLVPCLVGLVPLFAARTRRMAFFYGTVAILSIVLALGAQTPVYDLYARLPFATAFRFPSRFLWVTGFCLAVLTALGVEALASSSHSTGWQRPLLVAAIALPLLSLFVLTPDGLRPLEWQVAGLVLGAGAIVAVAPRLAQWAPAVVLLALTVQLLRAPSSPTVYLLGWDPDYFGAQGVFAALRARMGPQDRVYLVHGSQHRFMAKSASLYRLPTVLDYEPLVAQRYAELSVMLRAGHRMTDLNDANYRGPRLEPSFSRRLLDLTASRYVAAEANFVGDIERIVPPLPRVATIDDVTVFENPLSLPRAFYVPRVEVVSDPDALLARLASGGDDLRQVALVEELPPSGRTVSGNPPAESSVEFAHNDPEHVTLDVEAPKEGFVVLTDQYFPGWVATVDGRPVPIQRANYAFRLVEVPAGRSTVEFRYRPGMLRLGAAVSAASLATVIGLLAWSWRKPRRVPSRRSVQ